MTAFTLAQVQRSSAADCVSRWPRFTGILLREVPCGSRVGRQWVDQVQDLLRPVEDAHAQAADLLRISRPGLLGDVRPGEAVSRLSVESCECGCDKLRYRLS